MPAFLEIQRDSDAARNVCQGVRPVAVTVTKVTLSDERHLFFAPPVNAMPQIDL